nr:YkvA family protein [Rhodoligotrophos appendicifer]
MQANEKRVRRGFWRKLGRVATRLPFAETIVAAYYCALDPATPTRAKAILLAALAYFVLPFDVVPDFLIVLGFTDDAAVMFAAMNMITAYMKPAHYEQAKASLERIRAGGKAEA